MMREMDTEINIVNFIRARTLNYHQFVALLTEAENENGEIIYRTNVRRLRWRVCFVTSLDLLKDMKSFREEKGKSIEEMKDEGRMIELSSFFVHVTGHMNNLTKGLQGKDNLITAINDKTFKIKLLLWESQLKLHNLVHSSRLKSLDTICPERIQEFSQSIFAPRRVRRMIPGLHNSKSQIFAVYFTYTGRR